MQWLLMIICLFVTAAHYVESAVVPHQKCPQGMKLDGSTCVIGEDLEASQNYNVSMEGDEASKEPTSVNAECLPRSNWESNCHSCECSESGVAKCVKQNNCQNDHALAEPIHCKPNTTFNKGCNTCVCLENGLGLCTLENCAKSSVSQKSELLSGKECAPGSSWRSQCNVCRCNDNGIALCTRASCPGQEQEPIMRCAPDTTWNYDCNTCWCTTTGNVICTRVECIGADIRIEEDDSQTRSITKADKSVSRKTRALQQAELPKACQPGQEFRMDCNKCLCDNEGQNFSCTRIDCSAVNNNHETDAFSSSRTKREVTKQETKKCVPGSVFDQGCNVCRCTDEGHHATCTLKRCHQENEVDVQVPEQDPGFRCNAGEQFTRDCNDCTCSADGKSIFCTIRLCDQDLTPDI